MAALAGQIRRWAKWLVPGIRVKRWLLLVALGTFVTSVGVALITNAEFGRALDAVIFQAALALRLLAGSVVRVSYIGWATVLAGLWLLFLGVRGTIRSIAGVFLPRGDPGLVDLMMQRRSLDRGPRIAVIGGGTGLSTLLRGLKRYTANLTAVVTVFDDGGSSGRLREELGILPPGDIRNCLVALAEAEPLMTDLFQYRFPGRALGGHAFGNLFIAALADVSGDLEAGLREASRVLKIRGRVLPTTTDNVVLRAEFDDGVVVEGESRISKRGGRIRRLALHPAGVRPLPEVIDAIYAADLIALGPGSLYTSVISNLLVLGVVEALRAAHAPVLYICNVMTQPGETDGFSASDHVRALVDLIGPGVLTAALVNVQAPRNQELLQRYREEGAAPVAADLDRVRALGVEPIPASLISEDELLRHDPARLGLAVMQVLERTTHDGLRRTLPLRRARSEAGTRA